MCVHNGNNRCSNCHCQIIHCQFISVKADERMCEKGYFVNEFFYIYFIIFIYCSRSKKYVYFVNFLIKYTQSLALNY